MKDMGKLHYLLGISVQMQDGKVMLDQKQYLINILRKFGLEDAKTVSTPSDQNVKLDKEDGYSNPVDATYYQSLVGSLLYELQELADCFATAATSFGLTVSIKKTEVLRQLAPNTARPPPNITMDGNALKNVDTFKYLGSCINSAANLDDEVLCRISRASQAFGRLHTRVWHERGISIKTKLSVYRAVVLPSLLYGCETWTCCRRHTKKLDQFHLCCLRKVLRVSWKEHEPNQEILRSAELTGIEAMLNQAQLRWSGHVTRMDDSRLPKQLFHAELSTGKRHKGGQRKRYKDVLKSTLKACNIPVDEWQALAQDRPQGHKAL